jgi:SAM-dependent methyltransferase
MAVAVETRPRKACVLCEDPRLERIARVPAFPVFMACTERPRSEDPVAVMEWALCGRCGTVQLASLPPVECVYREEHNESVGPTWREHDRRLEALAREHGGPRAFALEGGAASHDPTGVAPAFEPDTIVHAHVMEHWREPRRALAWLARLLGVGGRMVFSIPDMDRMLERRVLGALHFEHTFFLSAEVAEYLLAEAGFAVLERRPLPGHSLFYACEKRQAALPRRLPRDGERNRGLLLAALEEQRALSARIAGRVSGFGGPAFLFGAHVFAQYLLALGLDEELFEAVLDNGSRKQGRRLSGTELRVRSPETLRGRDRAIVALRAGVYDAEIRRDVRERINPRVVFC